MKNEVLNSGEAHKSYIETAKQLVPSESRDVARCVQAFFSDAFTLLQQKTIQDIEYGLQKRKLLTDNEKLFFHSDRE